jgi:MFS family permease
MGKTTAVLRSEAPLIAGISLIQLVNGYIGTLIGLRLVAAGVDPLAIGIVTSGFFIGYVIGSLLCDRLIQRTGHIRAFSTFAAIEAISILGLSLYFGVIPWLLLRLLAGFACAGLFIATESWLSAKSTAATRGKVFAVYMVATYLTFGGSQFVLTIAPPTSAVLFELAAIVLCIALALVATTRSDQPAPAPSDRLKSGELLRAAPVGVVGCLAGGLASGAFFALMPVYGQTSGLSVINIATYMALAIFGGLLLQVPTGKLSDRFDRRVVAGLCALAFSILAIMIVPARPTHAFPALWLLLGGFMSVIYPVCVAHVNDRMPRERAVAVSGRLILVCGAGSAIGPILGSAVMSTFGVGGLFNFLAAVTGLFALFALARGLSVAAPRLKRRRPFVMIQTIFSHDLAHAPDEVRTGA